MKPTQLNTYAGRLWIRLAGQWVGFAEAQQRIHQGDPASQVLRAYVTTERRRCNHALGTERKITNGLQRYYQAVTEATR